MKDPTSITLTVQGGVAGGLLLAAACALQWGATDASMSVPQALMSTPALWCLGLLPGLGAFAGYAMDEANLAHAQLAAFEKAPQNPEVDVLTALVGTILDAVLLVASDGKVLHANAPAAALFNTSVEALQRSHIDSLVIGLGDGVTAATRRVRKLPDGTLIGMEMLASAMRGGSNERTEVAVTTGRVSDGEGAASVMILRPIEVETHLPAAQAPQERERSVMSVASEVAKWLSTHAGDPMTHARVAALQFTTPGPDSPLQSAKETVPIHDLLLALSADLEPAARQFDRRIVQNGADPGSVIVAGGAIRAILQLFLAHCLPAVAGDRIQLCAKPNGNRNAMVVEVLFQAPESFAAAAKEQLQEAMRYSPQRGLTDLSCALAIASQVGVSCAVSTQSGNLITYFIEIPAGPDQSQTFVNEDFDEIRSRAIQVTHPPVNKTRVLMVYDEAAPPVAMVAGLHQELLQVTPCPIKDALALIGSSRPQIVVVPSSPAGRSLLDALNTLHSFGRIRVVVVGDSDSNNAVLKDTGRTDWHLSALDADAIAKSVGQAMRSV